MRTENAAFIAEFRRNWPMLAIAFSCLLFAFSVPLIALPFLFGPVMDEFGWTREQVTLLASAKFATGAVFSIIAGRFIDAIGVRKTLIFVSAAAAVAMVILMWTPNLAIYYLSGVLLGIAAPGTIIAVKVLVSRSFHASQGTAMGVVMLATGIGAVTVPVLVTPLIAAMGWRLTIAMLSLGIWLITLPLLIFACKDESFTVSGEGAVSATPPHDRWGALGELTKMRDFWLIGMAVMMAGFVDQAFMQHQVLYLTVDLGMSTTLVAGIVSAIGLVSIAARIAVGSVFDRASAKGVSLMYLVLAVACLFAMGLLNPYVLGAFVIFRAVGHSAVLLDTTILTKHRFGLANIGVLLGLYTALVNVGFALGPWVVARMYDSSGSYTTAFLLCTVMALAAAAILLPVKPLYWLEMRQRLGSKATPIEKMNVGAASSRDTSRD